MIEKYALVMLLFCLPINALIISEVMFDPIDDLYNEWVEIYNDKNFSINISNLTICEDLIHEGYSDMDENITNATGYIIEPYSYFIITDKASAAKENYKINSRFFHVKSSNICDRLSNSGENITISFDKNYSFDYTPFVSDENYAPYYDNGYHAGCIENGTPGYFEACTKNIEFDYDFSISHYIVTENDTLMITTNITSPNTTKANLTIKIGEKATDGYNYFDILMEEEIILENGTNEYIFEWSPKDVLSGDYKAYSRLLTNYDDKRPYELFKVRTKANIFITDYYIDNNLSYKINISNEEDPINVTYGILIDNFKTATGKFDYYHWCNTTEIIGNMSFSCKTNQKFISGNYSTYPVIRFEYENQTLVREGEKIRKEFLGLDDLGEPNMTIISYQNSSFGAFSNVLVLYKSNNYDMDLNFYAYGYPKQVLGNYDSSSISANDYENDLAVSINTKRAKEYYLSIPYLAKSNCNNYYDSDEYRIRVRAYDIKNDDELMTEDFYPTISGKNNNLCPVTPKKSKSSTYVAPSVSNGFTYGDVHFDIDMPESSKGDYQVNINMTNKLNTTNEFTIEAYLYSNKRYSKDNEMKMSLEPEESRNIKLTVSPEKLDDKDYKTIIKINNTNRKSIKTYSKPIQISSEYNKIESFYTLQKNFDGEITLFARAKANEGLFEIISEHETKTKEVSDKNSFKMKAYPGKNTFFLLLKKNNITLDVKKLQILADESKIVDELVVPMERLGVSVTGNAVKPVSVELDKGVKKLINYLFVFVIIGFFYLWRKLN